MHERSKLVATLAILTLLAIAGCEVDINHAQQPQLTGPELALAELAQALHDGDKNRALQYIVLGSQEYYDEVFSTLGPSGMSEYADDLELLTLSSIGSDKAIFTGTWNINGKTLGVTVTFIHTDEGFWKFRDEK